MRLYVKESSRSIRAERRRKQISSNLTQKTFHLIKKMRRNRKENSVYVFKDKTNINRKRQRQRGVGIEKMRIKLK